jgi:hypothetical protein
MNPDPGLLHDLLAARRSEVVAPENWYPLLNGLLDAIRNGGVRDEWLAAGVLADYLDELDTGTLIPYRVHQSVEEGWEPAGEVAWRIREVVQEEQRWHPGAVNLIGGRVRVVLDLAKTRAIGLLLPDRVYLYKGV